jgi:hypothetical protein
MIANCANLLLFFYHQKMRKFGGNLLCAACPHAAVFFLKGGHICIFNCP